VWLLKYSVVNFADFGAVFGLPSRLCCHLAYEIRYPAVPLFFYFHLPCCAFIFMYAYQAVPLFLKILAMVNLPLNSLLLIELAKKPIRGGFPENRACR